MLSLFYGRYYELRNVSKNSSRARARFDLRAAGGQAALALQAAVWRLLTMASLVDAILEAKTCDALREFLRNNGLHTSGKKAVLILR